MAILRNCDFTATDATTWGGYSNAADTPASQLWTALPSTNELSAQMLITSNRLRLSGTANTADGYLGLFGGNLGVAAAAVHFKMRWLTINTSSLNLLRVIARVTTGLNPFYDAGWRPTTGNLSIRRYNSAGLVVGAESNLFAWTPTVNTDYVFGYYFNGSNHSLFLDGVLVCSLTDAGGPNVDGAVGIYQQSAVVGGPTVLAHMDAFAATNVGDASPMLPPSSAAYYVRSRRHRI